MRRFLKCTIILDVFIAIFFSLVLRIILSNPQNIIADGLLVAVLALIWIIGIAIGLNIYFFSMAVDFRIDDRNITFEYYSGKLKVAAIEDVVEVRCTPQRYTFKTKDGEKLYLGRQIGLIKIEKDVNPQIQATFTKSIEKKL